MKKVGIVGFLLCVMFFGAREGFAYDSDLLDLRATCNICKGNARNYSILNAYFSNSTGQPPSDLCENSGEPLFISVLYTSNSKNDINNVRLIADILKKDRNNASGDPLDSYYFNEFIGTVAPCPDGACLFTIPLPASLNIECANEFYELSQPLVAWTTNSSQDLEFGYDCQDYPAAQCLNQPTIPIEVGALSYAFEPTFDCNSGAVSTTNVSFLITSLFGGNPTLDYTTLWEFTYADGTSEERTEFTPVLANKQGGSIIGASLTVSQNPLNGDKISRSVNVPVPLSYDAVVDTVLITNTDEGTSNGVIDVTLTSSDVVHFWTSLDNPEFYSESTRIEELAGGTYLLTTFDITTSTCRTDLFDISSTILPVRFIYNRTNYNSKFRNSLISWATATEWESSHFEIERSIGSVDDFQKIGVVMAMGWKDSATEYTFIDKDLPLYETNILYRIKQIDLNDAVDYSSVMSIRTPEVKVIEGVWKAYPNPTYDSQLRIRLLDPSKYQGEKIRFRILHPTMPSKEISVGSEAEMNEALNQLIPSVSKGVLVVEIYWGQKVERIKVLKL
nr:hypothetical protein [Cytophagales bacterium]